MLILLFLASFLSKAQEQVRITTNVLPPYSPYIQDYPGTGNRVQVFISNLSRRPMSVRLIGKLEGDNGVVIRTSANYRPLQPLQLLATDVNRLITRSELEGLFDLNQIEVSGMDKNLLYRGLPLPEGNYQLCIQAFDNATIRPVSAEFPMGCSGLIPIRIVEPPILISPMADEQIAVKTPQTQLFTWSAPVGILPNQVEYSIRIVELPESNIDPNVFIDAVVLPRSGVEMNNLRTTTFLYGPQHPPLEKGKRYAWRVQAKPVGQKLNFLNEGKSPVQAFTYGLQIPLGVDMEYITVTKPTAKRNATVEVGSNNPFKVSWKLDEDFEKLLRKAFEAQPKKSLVEQFGELSYRVLIKSDEKRAAGTVVLDRLVRVEELSLQKSELPANMLIGKDYQVQIELVGMSELRRKRALLTDAPLISKSRSFTLIEKNLGNEADSLTIKGLLTYRFPGESTNAQPLPNTRVMLMKIFPNRYRTPVAYGMSDAYGNYTIKVLKSTLHGPTGDSTVFTRCMVDPIHPFVQTIAEGIYYQKTNDNTFTIASSQQEAFEVKGITWLATGYTLDVTAKQSYKNWPNVPDVDLEGKHLVIYRKKGMVKEYDKFRLPYEGAPLPAASSASQPIQVNNNSGFQSINTVNDKLGASVTSASDAVSGKNNAKTAEELQNVELAKELASKGYEFIGKAALKSNGTGFGTTFKNLVYAGVSYDTYRIYCPDCGFTPDDADPVVFLKPQERLAASPARVEKYTYHIQTDEAPTMTFTGKLTYKFADAGKEGAQVKALGNTRVHLEVVYRNTSDKNSTFGSNPGYYQEFTELHNDFNENLDTKVTAADGSFSFTVKMTKEMQLGTLPPTVATGYGEFKIKSAVFVRGIRVVVDNPYYASPTETFGLVADQQLKPQGSYDFGPVTAVVRSYTLVTQIKSDTTGISLVNKQKADIKSDLFGINVSVLRKKKITIGTIGINSRPPADEGSGAKADVIIKGEHFTVVAKQETDVNGIARFPRMVMANGELDAYFVATESSVDGLNNYNLVTLKRITVSEEWGATFSANATAEEIARSETAHKTNYGGATVDCKNMYDLLYLSNPNYSSTYDNHGTYTEAEYDQMKAENHPPQYKWVSHQVGCKQVNNYWLGEKLHDVKLNDVILLTKNTNYGQTLFADQYKTFESEVVKRHLAPGNPVVNVRVVDKTNPTQGIKNAVVKLNYHANGAFLNTTLTQYTDEEGWILSPFQLKPGTDATLRIKAEGYIVYSNIFNSAWDERIINIGDVLLGQNSYYSAVLMEPNTTITGRAMDADAIAGPIASGSANVYVGGKDQMTQPITVSQNAAGNQSAAKPIETNKVESLFDYDNSLEAYAQADDGNMVKTKFDEGTWKFALKVPSTSSVLKLFPVNISYFGEQRNIKTQLPKPVKEKNLLFNINAGDINIYERDHRITFTLLDDLSGKKVPGAFVRLFGKKSSGNEFGPSMANGQVETKFKNVSIDNLYVEITAPGYVTRTVAIKNEETKTSVPQTIRLEPARTVKGMVVLKSASGIETPLQGALVFVSGGGNAPLKYSTVSGSDGSFLLDVSKKFDGSSIKVETIFDPKTAGNSSLPAGATYVGSELSQLIPQVAGQSLKLTVTTFDKFKIATIWGFPVTIEKMDPKTMQVSGEVDLTDGAMGPFAIIDKNRRVRFKNVIFKADPQHASVGIPANETVELEVSVLNNLVYHTSPTIDLSKVKYNIKLSTADGMFGKLKIVRTPGTSTGRIMAKAQIIDNSFNFSANLLSYEKGQFSLSDPDAPGKLSGTPLVTAFDAAKTNIKWTNFNLSQENGAAMTLKLLSFDAVSKLEGSKLIGDEIHLNPTMTCKIKDANPAELKVSIGNLILKNKTIDAKTGDTPLTFPLAGKWSVEIRDWKLDFKKGGFYSKSGVIKTGKADIPIKDFNLRSDFYNLLVEPTNLELAGVANLKLGGQAYFGFDPQTGSDMKGHWSVVVVPNGNSPAAVLSANSVPGLTQDMQFETLSLLDNGEDVVSFGSGSKTFKYFNIIDVRPTTIETGSNYFAFDAGMSSQIPNAPQDISMRFIYSKPEGAVKLTTKIPGGYKLQTKGYQTFEAGQYVAPDKSQTTAIFFADGVMAIKGRIEEPGKLKLDDVLLVHNNSETHITHGRNFNLANPFVVSQWKTSLANLTDPVRDNMNYNETGDFKQMRISLGGNSNLSKVYAHQSVTNKQWELLKFSGLPQGFSKMLGEDEKNRLSFTAYGEIKAEGQKIKMDGIDTGMGGLSLVYDHEKKRLTGSMQLSNLPVPPTMTFMNGMAQVRLDANGFYIVATGELQNVPLIVPVTMRSGLMLGVYTSNDLGDATQVLFANSHRKELPCTFTSGFKGIYATGEVPVPIIGSYKQELSVPGIGGYKVGLDAYVDGYVFGNYDNGNFGVGGGLGVGAHAYAYGTVLSLSAGGEINVEGGVDAQVTVNPGSKNVSVKMAANLGAGFSVNLTESFSGLVTGTTAGFCLTLSGEANYTIGSSPGFGITPSFKFEECTSDCATVQ